MTSNAWVNLLLYLGVLLTLAPFVGVYIAKVMLGEYRVLKPVESGLLRLCGVAANREQDWLAYARSILLFSLVGAVMTYAIQRLQAVLPLNPQAMGAITPDSAFNTAISFATNTNWQGYAGEATMSYLSQMVGLVPHNFMSAATGIAVAMAVIRGFARQSSATIGNAWVDLTRATLFVLLPGAIVLALLLAGQGVIQNFEHYRSVTPLEVAASAPPADAAAAPPAQVLPMGPIASQESIKMLGTNGGGFLNANSAHPFENPTPLSNFLQMIAIFIIPAALTFTFGRLVGDRRQGWALLAAMLVLFVPAVIALTSLEQAGNPLFNALGIDQATSALQAGGNMEGKETRFGISTTALFAAITTSASSGAVNAMHDSFTALGGLVPLALMQLGEVVFGGVGTGLYTMLIFAIIAVFIAGLMIGRTPEYLGKKIEAFDIKMASITILVTPVLVLAGTAWAVSVESGTVGIWNPGAHGFSEVLYAFTSAANNNGSAFAGLSANTPFYNALLGIAMWFGRFAMIVPILAVAGSLAAKKRIPITAGTMPTHGPLFVLLLVGTVLLVGALNYLPANALGPVVEHFMVAASAAPQIGEQ